MRVEWTAAAIRDRDEVFYQIAADDPSAAERMDIRFETSTARLADFPYLARPGRIPGTRELIPHESYRIVYQIVHDAVLVLAVLHTSRQWPPGEDET